MRLCAFGLNLLLHRSGLAVGDVEADEINLPDSLSDVGLSSRIPAYNSTSRSNVVSAHDFCADVLVL